MFSKQNKKLVNILLASEHAKCDDGEFMLSEVLFSCY
jgi:hypothetical protein